MQLTTKRQRARSADEAILRRLSSLILDERRAGQMRAALQLSGGDAAWRGRKQAEAHDLLALSQAASPGRLEVLALDLAESLRAMIVIQVPVPCRPDMNQRLRIASHAMIGLTYRRDALTQHLPGYAFVEILEPRGVWLPAVDETRQALCLGTELPIGVRVSELVLMTYGAISMQTVQLDERDSAGVFNPAAAVWWQQNTARIPLTRTPFLMQQQ